MVKCAVIADDLTGANATGVMLKKQGYVTSTIMNLVKSEKVALNDGNEEYANSIRDIQKEFIKTHLLPFALLFLPALTDASKNPFYADAAEIALEFLLSDYEELCKE